MLDTTEKDINPKPFWRYVKSQQQDSTGVSSLREIGKLHSDPKSKSSILQSQLKSVFTSDDDGPHKDLKMEGPSFSHISLLQMDIAGVQKFLANINPSKAGGPDEIAGRLMEELASELAPFFSHMFNLSLDTGNVPPLWKEQWINPIFKKGNKSEPENYRPVSLTCLTSKIMEHIICSII